MTSNNNKFNHEMGDELPLPIYAGIDISMDYLDVFLAGGYHRFANDKGGHDKMIHLFERQSSPVHAVYESTGYLSRRLIPLFMEKGISQSCLNPIRVRNYARGEGIQAKTDQLDCRLLALMGQSKQLKADYPLSRQIMELKECESVLSFYIKRRTQLKNQLKAVNLPLLKHHLEQSLSMEEDRIEQMVRNMEAIIDGHEELKRRYESYLAVTGIGKRSAMALISLMPELGSLNRSQAASLLGVAPYAWESGHMKGTRRIKGGRKPLRSILYLATVSAVRSNEVLQRKYRHLRECGKSGPCALIACCRTMIIHLNSVARRVMEEQKMETCQGS